LRESQLPEARLIREKDLKQGDQEDDQRQGHALDDKRLEADRQMCHHRAPCRTGQAAAVSSLWASALALRVLPARAGMLHRPHT